MLLSVIVGLSTGAALLIVSLPKVYASTVGPNSPTAAATVANGSSTSWTNPTNAEASDGVYASVGLTKNGISDYLETTGYSFAVPSTATIDGIYVQVQKYATSTSDDSIADQTVSLVVGGSVAGSNLATTSTWPSTDTSTYYGSSTNLWGNSLTPSQINAGNFGVAVAVQDVHATGKATNVTAYVDYVSVTVYYSTSISLNQSSYQLYQNQAGSPAGGANWSEATGGAAWSARSFQSSLVYDNKMWIMGGYNALGSSYYNDVWYSTNGVNWTEATSAAPWVARYGATALVYNNEMWIMGGNYNTTYYNDVWYSTNGVNWTEATSAASWAVREGATALVYNNEMWIMSGWSSSSGYYNDVWYSTNGVNWTEATSAASWTVRYEATSLVYNNEMWIMGGTGSSGYLNDVWYSSNGVNWTEATSAAPWVVRSGATSLVYDNEMWIMGGSYNNNYYNDVWFSTLPPISVGSSLAAQNTAATVPGNQQPFRLRQDIAVTGSNLAANSLTLQLQYALMSGGSCSATPAANYSNVTDHSTIQYYQNQYAANGQSLNTTSGEPTDGSNTIVPEEYLGYGTTTFSNPAAINAGEDGMWDFALTTYNALPGQQYCFQIISGGAALNTYTDYPEIIIPASTITQSSYRFYQNKDATTSTASWTEATSAAPWAGRDNFTSLVYNNEMWIMGGSNASGNLNDVWYSSNGVNWTEATSAAPWAARFGATSLVYNNEMWIMGGSNGSTFYNDVWYYAVPMIDVGSPLSNQNTPVDLNGPALKQPFRLRLDIAIGESQQQSNNLSLELQYAELGDYANCSSVPSTNYANVSSTTPIQYYTNVVATNGMALLPDANDPTDGSNMIVYQTYNQANPFVNAQGTIYAGEDGLWDFALAVSSSSYDHASYCLRVANSSNGSAINTYTDYPQINLAPTMSQVMNFRNWWNSSGVQQNLDIYHD